MKHQSPVFIVVLLSLAAGLLLGSCAPASVASTASPELVAVYSKAKAAWVAGDTAQTRVLLEPLVKANPEFVPSRFLLGRALFFAKDYAAAEKQLREVIKRQPSNLEALVWLAQVFAQSGHEVEAEQLIAEGLAANPDDPRLAFLMASLYEQKDNLAGALGFLAVAERLEEDLSLIYLQSARLRWRLDQVADARLRLEKAKAILPSNSALAAPVDILLAQVTKADQNGRGGK